MKYTAGTLILLLSFMLAGESAHAFGRSRPRPTPTPAPPVSYNYSAEELEGVRLINEYRASIGLSTLTLDNYISTLCETHNQYMIQKNTASHDYFTTRADSIKARLGATRVSEIVAYNYISPASVVNAWLNSPGHKAAIERPYHRRIGYSMRINPANNRKFYTAEMSD